MIMMMTTMINDINSNRMNGAMLSGGAFRISCYVEQKR